MWQTLIKTMVEFAAHMRNSHRLNLPPTPKEVGTNDMEARRRDAQALVTKMDMEAQRIGSTEQQCAAASNHWIEMERKVAAEQQRTRENFDALSAFVTNKMEAFDSCLQDMHYLQQENSPMRLDTHTPPDHPYHAKVSEAAIQKNCKNPLSGRRQRAITTRHAL